MDERRRSQRYTVSQETKGKVRSTLEVRIIDISEHGLQVESSFGLPPNGECAVSINTPSGAKNLTACVKRCRAQMVKNGKNCEILYRTGLEFEEAQTDTHELKKLITEICLIENSDKPNGSNDSEGFKFAM